MFCNPQQPSAAMTAVAFLDRSIGDPTSLTVRALTNLRNTFEGMGHHPSDEMWRAIEAIMSTMEAMADGTADSLIHVSTLEPGVGKTQAMLAFLRALLVSPEHEDVSALICVARLDEISKLALESNLPTAEYAVLTSDDTVNALGNISASTARVLFTTHAMLDRQCNGRPFADVSPLHYQGVPRQVRVYDEAILPGRTITIPRDNLLSLVKELRGVSPSFADAVDDFQHSLRTAGNRTQCQLPNLAIEHNVALADAKEAVKGNALLTATVEALWSFFGRTMSVRCDPPKGNTLLEYAETLSPDIAPLLVLDASARVRGTYKLWEAQRGGIKRLPEASKDYSPHTFHVWDTGGGKSAFRNNGQVLIDGIARTINTKPDEPWLVIHHLNTGCDFKKELERLLDRKEKVSFLTWGRHDATNQFKDCPNVILAGTLFKPASVYESLTRLAADHPSSRGNVRDEDYAEIERGEHRHAILQAVCRGKVRQCDGGRCFPTNTYLIASKRSGIADDLPLIFRNCQVTRWGPVTTDFKGKAANALAFIATKFDHGAVEVTFKEVKEHIQVPNAANFAKNVRKHKRFMEGLFDRGITEWPTGRPRAFVLAGQRCFEGS